MFRVPYCLVQQYSTVNDILFLLLTVVLQVLSKNNAELPFLWHSTLVLTYFLLGFHSLFFFLSVLFLTTWILNIHCKIINLNVHADAKFDLLYLTSPSQDSVQALQDDDDDDDDQWRAVRFMATEFWQLDEPNRVVSLKLKNKNKKMNQNNHYISILFFPRVFGQKEAWLESIPVVPQSGALSSLFETCLPPPTHLSDQLISTELQKPDDENGSSESVVLEEEDS